MLSINKWELDLPRVLIFEPNSSPYLEVELIAFNVLYSAEGYKLTPLKNKGYRPIDPSVQKGYLDVLTFP